MYSVVFGEVLHWVIILTLPTLISKIHIEDTAALAEDVFPASVKYEPDYE